MGNFEASNIRVQDLDHCGIVAGICDEMGLVEQIDKLLGIHPQEIISPGRVVKATILNGLGFVSAPLYLFEKFFVGKATEHLLGEGIRPEHLNDRAWKVTRSQHDRHNRLNCLIFRRCDRYKLNLEIHL
jgi:transposase